MPTYSLIGPSDSSNSQWNVPVFGPIAYDIGEAIAGFFGVETSEEAELLLDKLLKDGPSAFWNGFTLKDERDALKAWVNRNITTENALKAGGVVVGGVGVVKAFSAAGTALGEGIGTELTKELTQ